MGRGNGRPWGGLALAAVAWALPACPEGMEDDTTGADDDTTGADDDTTGADDDTIDLPGTCVDTRQGGADQCDQTYTFPGREWVEGQFTNRDGEWLTFAATGGAEYNFHYLLWWDGEDPPLAELPDLESLGPVWVYATGHCTDEGLYPHEVVVASGEAHQQVVLQLGQIAGGGEDVGTGWMVSTDEGDTACPLRAEPWCSENERTVPVVFYRELSEAARLLPGGVAEEDGFRLVVLEAVDGWGADDCDGRVDFTNYLILGPEVP